MCKNTKIWFQQKTRKYKHRAIRWFIIRFLEKECEFIPPKSIGNNIKTVPNLIGPPLPWRDQGDREYYCSTMLTFFKPWHTGNDLKALNTTWGEEFSKYEFTAQHNQFMQNFNTWYECPGARDDYCAQIKNGVDPLFVGNWEDTNDNFGNTNDPSLNANIAFDDDPQDLQNIGNAQISRMKNIAQIDHIFTWNRMEQRKIKIWLYCSLF